MTPRDLVDKRARRAVAPALEEAPRLKTGRRVR
ncbi:hypothetical protein IEO21_10679 [Rhodonia placenta]|uniref:Uncharacterized protein n=1 Tax=Rhodonia placenta TaxID=104341 RepID=A0A8H7NSA7_9APHY|nr:hypothetical protein IEO21_10679 [Postia placenta]